MKARNVKPATTFNYRPDLLQSPVVRTCSSQPRGLTLLLGRVPRGLPSPRPPAPPFFNKPTSPKKGSPSLSKPHVTHQLTSSLQKKGRARAGESYHATKRGCQTTCFKSNHASNFTFGIRTSAGNGGYRSYFGSRQGTYGLL